MTVNPIYKSLITLNLGIIFISTSGALGRYISMLPVSITFWRASIAVLALGILGKVMGVSFALHSRKDTFAVFASGIFLILHWITYFYSLQLSNVAIGMLSLFTFPLFTAFLEPLLLKTPFKARYIFLGVIMLFGLYMLIPGDESPEIHWAAVPLGVVSAMSYSLRNIILKPRVHVYHGLSLMFWQLLAGAFALLFFLPSSALPNFQIQWQSVLFLALITTVAGHTLFLISLKSFSITSASIISCSQPIFGIIIGIVFLNEVPTWGTMVGGACILVAVVFEAFFSAKERGGGS